MHACKHKVQLRLVAIANKHVVLPYVSAECVAEVPKKLLFCQTVVMLDYMCLQFQDHTYTVLYAHRSV